MLLNPLFLVCGIASRDLNEPDRVLRGRYDDALIDAWLLSDRMQVLRDNLWSGETSKLTANAFVDQRITPDAD